ncbi:MAG: AAA family ATPase [Candidatus Krumholzibacteriota bacterium]|nr:AAA family ATPase [Candidatus Krumholzibacteriota bacterium]
MMSNRPKTRSLPVNKMRWRCPQNLFKFKTTEHIKPCDNIIGQDRALMSIGMGLNLEHRGYNIFITGLAGTGRTTTIKHLLEKMERKDSIPKDICYMHNFRDENMPLQIELEPGEGIRLAAEMDGLIFNLTRKIPSMLKSDYYQTKQKKLVEAHQEKQKKIVSAFEKKIGKEGFTMISVQVGGAIRPQIVPVMEGKPVDYSQIVKMIEEGTMTQDQFESMKAKAEALSEDMTVVYEQMKNIEKELKEQLEKLDKEFIYPVVHSMIVEIDKLFANKKLSCILRDVENAINKKQDLFKKDEDSEDEEQVQLPGGDGQTEEDDPFREFRVNVLIDNSDTEAPPVIIENFPNLKNVFGIIERDFYPGGWSKTDHLNIKPGSFHKANGGFLVMNAMDVFIEPGVWQTLKRTLKSSESIIQNFDAFSYMSSSALKPEPLQVKTKIVLIGDSRMYYLLQSYDEDFRKIFKIRADFDREVDRDHQIIRQYAGFIKSVCDRENLLHFDRSGVAAVIEYGVKLAGRQSKISTRFSMIADIIREASYQAKAENDKIVGRKEVEKALEYRIMRVNLFEDKLQERIDDGTILIETSGSVVGQVNALSVYNLGDYSFGRPSRITVRTSLGNSGVINIERESDLSGNTHNKGVLILSGYLRGKYGNESPLVMSASLCFEQSYGGVDGDSASSTELYAILSSLSGLPLRQDLAVTGSINQNGEIQPIGGVNEKIEGFFNVCQSKGLKGTEGVIIPWQNVQDLMLSEKVVEAAKKGRFHIYPVKHVDEGISLLTGVKAGKQLSSGKYTKGSVNDIVQRRLLDMALRWKKFGTDSKKKD